MARDFAVSDMIRLGPSLGDKGPGSQMGNGDYKRAFEMEFRQELSFLLSYFLIILPPLHISLLVPFPREMTRATLTSYCLLTHEKPTPMGAYSCCAMRAVAEDGGRERAYHGDGLLSSALV
jgi:hypothetical protein